MVQDLAAWISPLNSCFSRARWATRRNWFSGVYICCEYQILSTFDHFAENEATDYATTRLSSWPEYGSHRPIGLLKEQTVSLFTSLSLFSGSSILGASHRRDGFGNPTESDEWRLPIGMPGMLLLLLVFEGFDMYFAFRQKHILSVINATKFHDWATFSTKKTVKAHTHNDFSHCNHTCNLRFHPIFFSCGGLIPFKIPSMMNNRRPVYKNSGNDPLLRSTDVCQVCLHPHKLLR